MTEKERMTKHAMGWGDKMPHVMDEEGVVCIIYAGRNYDVRFFNGWSTKRKEIIKLIKKTTGAKKVTLTKVDTEESTIIGKSISGKEIVSWRKY